MEELRVLIVDDEPDMRQGTSRILSRHTHELPDFGTTVSFETAQAADGAEAVALLDAGGWDLMLLDYKLPDMTGLEILHHVQESDLEVETVMITAYASLDVAVSATKNGAFDFLAKPFSPEELRSVVNKAARSVLVHRHAHKLEQEKRQVRFQFISVLAHELKAPLGVVESFLRMIEDRQLGDDLADYDRMIDRALARVGGMRKMIVDLLDLTRLESGQKNRELEPVDLVEATRSSLENIQAQAEVRGLTMQLHAPDALELTADSGEVDIVLNNLLTNAVKYNRDGGRVDVTLKAVGAGVEIAVKDTGIGMAPDDVARLFGEFVRIKNDKTSRIDGSGLGLSILRKIAALYGGDVTVTSELDVGSEFTVTLGETSDE